MDLKLVVASTPKTGNTWLRHLLSEAYRLPMIALPPAFTEEEVGNLPSRWVSQEHYFPDGRLLDWGERAPALFLTTIRHPGDVLVSLYHYIRSGAASTLKADPLVDVMRFDHEAPGANVVDYVRRYFFYYLHLSIAWMATGRSIVVRYEDLCDDPEAEFARIVREIHARRPSTGLPLERVPGAVAACDLDVLRRTPGLDKRFFRKGGSGGWAEELPPEVHEIFRSLPPYPAQFAALGYDPDPARARRKKIGRVRSIPNPFAGRDQFDDGTGLSPFLVRVYFALDEELRARFSPTAGAAEPGSFLGWLKAPAEGDTEPGRQPLVTNLAAFIHSIRIDLQAEYPEPFGRHRTGFIDWLLRAAISEYALDPYLLVPVRDSYVAWATAPSAEAPPENDGPLLSNLAVAIRAARPDLQAAFPRLGPHGRIEYLIWFLSRARFEHQLDERVVEPVRRSFVEWAVRPVDGTASTNGATLTNLALHIHYANDWLHKIFPDVVGRDREAYVRWFQTKGQLEIPTHRTLEIPLSGDFVLWSSAPSPEDPDPAAVPRVTNLMVAIYRRRPDLQQAMPDLFGRDRLDFARWLVQYGEAEWGLTREYVAAFLESMCVPGPAAPPRSSEPA